MSVPTPMPKWPSKSKARIDVVPKKDDEDERDVEKIAVKILENEREARLAVIFAIARFADSAARWVEKEGTVVGLAVVVARQTKAERTTENQECG